MKVETIKGPFRVYWYEYPARQGAYGSGGWSRNAKHRPKPILAVHEFSEIQLSGASVLCGTFRKLKCVVVKIRSGEVLRDDYGIDRIKDDLFKATCSSQELETPAQEGFAEPMSPLAFLQPRKLAL